MVHRFIYSNSSDRVGDLDIIEEFLHGWCFILQWILLKLLPGSEPYEIFETNGEFWNDHQIIKFKGFYIDIRGIFTEKELLNEHRNEHVNTVYKYYKRRPIDNSKLEIDCYLAKSDYNTDDINTNELPYKCAEYAAEVILNDPVMKFLMSMDE